MSFLGEIKRRKVFQVAAVYGVVAWLIMQVVDVVAGPLLLPEWFARVVILLLAIGFPIAVILTWAFDLTPDGVVRDRGNMPTGTSTRRNIEYVLIGLVVVAMGWVIYRVEISPPGELITEVAAGLPNSVAVLPFENLSLDPENALFAEGIHIELLNTLHTISGVNAIGRDSVRQFRDSTLSNAEIARQLMVGAIVRGDVRYDGVRVLVSARLIDPRTNVTKWLDEYDGDLTDVFGFQAEIATGITMALEAELLPVERARITAERSENPQAIEAYLAGIRRVDDRTAESLLGAILHFQAAVELDPDFARAWSGLAEAWVELPTYSSVISPSRVRTETETAARKAEELDPESPNALAVLGWHLLQHDYEWSEAEELFQRALSVQAVNANALHWYSHLLSWQARHDAAIAAAYKAVDADPLSTLLLANASYILADAGRWNESNALGATVLGRGPFPSQMTTLWIANLRAGRPREAAVQLENWAAATGRDIEAAIELGEEIIRLQASGGSTERIGELISRVQLPASIAEIYAALGDAENTIAALQEEHLGRTGDRSLLSLKINPSYVFIHEDPRFIKLRDDIGLAN